MTYFWAPFNLQFEGRLKTLSSSPSIWYAIWPCSEKLNFWPPAPPSPTPGAWPRRQNKNPVRYVLYLWIFYLWGHTQSLVYNSLKLTLQLKFNDIWPFDPSPEPRGWGQKRCAVACPIHVSDSHTKFGWILFNGFGGDSITDRRRRDHNILRCFKKSVWLMTEKLARDKC